MSKDVNALLKSIGGTLQIRSARRDVRHRYLQRQFRNHSAHEISATT